MSESTKASYSGSVLAENKVKATVSQLLDPQKQPFFADKFLQTASEDSECTCFAQNFLFLFSHITACFTAIALVDSSHYWK